jgi:Fe-S-cluster containining protein
VLIITHIITIKNSQYDSMPFKCTRCGNCCKRYYITLLPEEMKKAAKELKISQKEFAENNCQLFLQLFPSDFEGGELKISAQDLEKKLRRKIEAHKGFLPRHFLALPCIAFKRKGTICIFYDAKKNICRIHSSKPMQCTLFPLLSNSENPDWEKLYPFCEGMKNSVGKLNAAEMKEHYAKIQEYFGKVAERGFKKTWKAWPKKGVITYNNKLLGKISEREFFEIIYED